MNDHENKRATFLVGVVAMVVAYTGGIVSGLYIMDSFDDPTPICHASTEELHEETVMLDCDFDNGVWYQVEGD